MSLTTTINEADATERKADNKSRVAVTGMEIKEWRMELRKNNMLMDI